MVKNQLKKVISFVMAVAVVLSLSCCGVGDEALIDEIDTETTSEATEEVTEELTTPETTTEETTETTTDETEEATTEATTLTISDEETILASLTDEEKEVWLSMPDIVTIRILNTYADESTEICYIEKNGGVKSFISDEYYDTRYGTIDQIEDKIAKNENVQIVDVADIHDLIEFYNTLMLIDNESKTTLRRNISNGIIVKPSYYYYLYGIRNYGENSNEYVLISDGQTGYPHRRKDPYGNTVIELYAQLDSYINFLAFRY